MLGFLLLLFIAWKRQYAKAATIVSLIGVVCWMLFGFAIFTIEWWLTILVISAYCWWNYTKHPKGGNDLLPD